MQLVLCLQTCFYVSLVSVGKLLQCTAERKTMSLFFCNCYVQGEKLVIMQSVAGLQSCFYVSVVKYWKASTMHSKAQNNKIVLFRGRLQGKKLVI